MNLPTTQQTVDTFVGNIETRIGQTTPLGDKAFNRVLAVTEAGGAQTALKFAADRARAAYVRTAQGADLDAQGAEVGVTRESAVAAVITASLAATDTTIVPLSWQFVSQTTGLVYQATTQVTAPFPGGTGTGVVVTLLCQTLGVIGNMSPGDTLAIQSPIIGAGQIATVTSVPITGAEAEEDEDYRSRILDVIQGQPNGSNGAQYRVWARTVAGIVNAYPFGGAPPPATSFPGQRTVYAECDTSINSDGIPGGSWTGSTSTPVGLVGQVATAIKTNANTGLGNEDLGLVDSGLFVLPISRTPMYVQITGLSVPSGQTAACQADILSAMTTFFLKIAPYCAGTDVLSSKNDTSTSTGVSMAIQQVLVKYGAIANTIAWGKIISTWITTYQVAQGEKLKLGSVSYV